MSINDSVYLITIEVDNGVDIINRNIILNHKANAKGLSIINDIIKELNAKADYNTTIKLKQIRTVPNERYILI